MNQTYDDFNTTHDNTLVTRTPAEGEGGGGGGGGGRAKNKMQELSLRASQICYYFLQGGVGGKAMRCKKKEVSKFGGGGGEKTLCLKRIFF